MADFEIRVVPCIDSLLYAPIHLAIIALSRRGTVRSLTRTQIEILNIPDKAADVQRSLSVDYKSAANGDEATLKDVVADATQKSVTIGICDPLTVLDQNFHQRALNPANWKPSHHIIGVLIDRISLALLARKPRTTSRKANDRALRNILEQFRRDGLNVPRVIAENAKSIVCDYWSPGNTTKFLAKRYLHLPEPSSPQTIGGGGKDINVDRLKHKEADIAITHAPWEIEPSDYFDVFCRECFPSIQFPF